MNALIIFVKNLQLGKVKTRLSKDIGDLKALEIYRQLVDHTFLVAGHCPDVQKYIFFSDYVEEGISDKVENFEYRIQGRGDLGKKMHQAINEVCQYHQKAILIGSDCPNIQPYHIYGALDILDEKDMVLGPSRDGGYYLIGMKKAIEDIFDGIEWSTTKVMDQTLINARKNNLSVGIGQTLRDIDTIRDYTAYTNQKQTLVFGASQKSHRYSYLAVERLLQKEVPVVAIGGRKGQIHGTPIITGHPWLSGIHTISMYMGDKRAQPHHDYLLSLNPKRIIFNPGAENRELKMHAKDKGIECLDACTLVMLSTGSY